MVAAQESINSRFCSVVEIKLRFFLKGGHLRGQALVLQANEWPVSESKWPLSTNCHTVT